MKGAKVGALPDKDVGAFRSLFLLLSMSEDSEPALLLCPHEVGGSGRFMQQQRALLALASAFSYMFLIEKCYMGK